MENWITITLDNIYEVNNHKFEKIFYKESDYTCAANCARCNCTFFGKITQMTQLDSQVLFTNSLNVGYPCPDYKVSIEDLELAGVGC